MFAMRAAQLFLLAMCLSLVACKKAEGPDTAEQIVDAAQYDAFWLWAGVKPQPELRQAKSIYILDSEYRAASARGLHILRPQIPQIADQDVWLVMRVETLNWDEALYDQLMMRLRQWDTQNRLVGLQIDFDAGTDGLSGYADFLRDLRGRLPPRYRLSITGLMDWAANGDMNDLTALGGTVDEIVIQTYQGRETVADYQDYFRRVDGLKIPFRIGLVQGGKWSAPENLESNPHFKGYVVFLLNPK